MRLAVAIVDSDAATRRALQALLATLDVEVQSHDSAEAFLAHSINGSTGRAARGLACLIVDARLSGISGVQLLKQVRATETELPIILLASEADVALAVEAMRHGATDFIEKPQMDVALLRRVAELLRNGKDANAQKSFAH
jgi:FixJ family two-component response regulator